MKLYKVVSPTWFRNELKNVGDIVSASEAEVQYVGGLEPYAPAPVLAPAVAEREEGYVVEEKTSPFSKGKARKD